jgi:hypothetical protein
MSTSPMPYGIEFVPEVMFTVELLLELYDPSC